MSAEIDLETPDDLQKELDELFPESVERRQIASVLMFWPTKPTTREAENIGTAVKRSPATVNGAVRILIENAYFSKDLGSMPYTGIITIGRGYLLQVHSSISQLNQMT